MKPKSIEKTQNLTRIAYELVRCDADLKTILDYVVRSVKDAVGCEAVAIRLEKDDDFPYYVYDGFSEDFISKESSLLVLDEGGKPFPCPDGCGKILDCMCGRVIMGETDISKPFFTPRGTFFSNSTSLLLENTSSDDRGGHTRNYCNACGFESVLLTPLLHRGEVIGLLQINDHRPDIFSPELVLSLEMLCDVISVVIGHKNMFASIREDIRSTVDDTPPNTLIMCSHCKAVKHNNAWCPIEAFVKKTANVIISHAICSACREDLLEHTFDMSNPTEHLK